MANISAYHTAQILGGALFPNYAAPYVFSPLKQCAGHIRRYVSLAFRRPENCDADLIRAKGDFFIACLQREGDAQLLRYSRYADNTAFLAAVIKSFAEQAPGASRLVVKNHPLDPGVIDLRKVALRLAREHGLEGRVDFIDGGNLAALCRASRGMVVNNSSAALSALGFHTPVKVMGDAFFDFEGLTDQQSHRRLLVRPSGAGHGPIHPLPRPCDHPKPGQRQLPRAPRHPAHRARRRRCLRARRPLIAVLTVGVGVAPTPLSLGCHIAVT